MLSLRSREQQLCRNGHGDHLGFLALDAFDADRADHAREHSGDDSPRLEAVQEARALAPGADQAEVAEIAAAQDGFGDAQVQVMAVREYEVEGAGRRCGDGLVSGAVRL